MMSSPESMDLKKKTSALFRRKGYQITKELGHGAFGKVYKAIKRGPPDVDCAVKVMDLVKCGAKFRQKFLPRELAVLIRAQHPNVIRIFDIFRANYKIYIFMEFAVNGDLAKYLKAHGPISEKLACFWFNQITSALNFLHTELRIAHRDIKIDNILLDEKKFAKLTDFGFAKESFDVKTNQVTLSDTFCGTEPYYSPQLVKRKIYNPFLADVWASGVVLFAMLNNKFVFHYRDKKVFYEEQTNPNFLETRYVREFSENYKHLQKRLLDPKESSRITVEEILSHPWIQSKGQ